MKILIVEDDHFFQKFYATKLLEHGFTVLIAKNGKEGLEMMRTMKPDLIILDIIMPIMDGFEVLEEKNKDDMLKKIPVMVFSTLGQDQDVEKAKKLGAIGYVNKSFFDLDKLLKKIASVTK